MKHWSLATLTAIVGIGVFAAPPVARADFSITLSNCNKSFNCSPSTGLDVGTVNVTDIAANEVQISVSLNANYNFANTGLYTLAFSLASGIGSATLSGFPTTGTGAFALGDTTSGPNPGKDDGMGTFQYALDLTGCNGNCGPSSLTFDVTANGLSAVLADFATGGSAFSSTTGYYFVADVGCSAPIGSTCTNGTGNGSTGLVGGNSSPVPAPILGAGLPGLIAACMGLVAFARRRGYRFA